MKIGLRTIISNMIPAADAMPFLLTSLFLGLYVLCIGSFRKNLAEVVALYENNIKFISILSTVLC